VCSNGARAPKARPGDTSDMKMQGSTAPQQCNNSNPCWPNRAASHQRTRADCGCNGTAVALTGHTGHTLAKYCCTTPKQKPPRGGASGCTSERTQHGWRRWTLTNPGQTAGQRDMVPHPVNRAGLCPKTAKCMVSSAALQEGWRCWGHEHAAATQTESWDQKSRAKPPTAGTASPSCQRLLWYRPRSYLRGSPCKLHTVETRNGRSNAQQPAIGNTA